MKQLIYIKCVLHLSCVVYGLIYARFMGCTVNGFLSVYSSTHNIYDKGEKGNIKQCLKIKRIEILNLCFTTQADTRQKAEPSGYGCDPFNQNSDRSDREKWSTSKGELVFSKPVGANRSIEFWTEISGNFGWMDRVLILLDIVLWYKSYVNRRLVTKEEMCGKKVRSKIVPQKKKSCRQVGLKKIHAPNLLTLHNPFHLSITCGIITSHSLPLGDYHLLKTITTSWVWTIKTN